MLYREIIAVCSQIHTKHINTLCGQNVELLNVELAVHIVTTVRYIQWPRGFKGLSDTPWARVDLQLYALLSYAVNESVWVFTLTTLRASPLTPVERLIDCIASIDAVQKGGISFLLQVCIRRLFPKPLHLAKYWCWKREILIGSLNDV